MTDPTRADERNPQLASGGLGPSFPSPLRAVPKVEAEDVPGHYGKDALVLLVRDPYWLHAFWEVTPERLGEAEATLGASGGERPVRVLRVYDVSGDEYDGKNANLYFDIHLDDIARNWYLRVDADRRYCAEIGLLGPSGEFVAIARSNTVRTPRSSMSDVIDEKWADIRRGSRYYEEMYALSGGFELGKSSLELRELMEQRLRSELASGAVSSFGGSPVRKRKARGFWFVLDAELIVYGATEPDATVEVQGQPVRLRPDGTFTLRFALPDGTQTIDAVATSADGKERRTIIPIVDRRTEVPAPVVLEDGEA
ncbi:MAG: DUF4912 domain-containing protein [Planctomycetes bacterium]|nr:DUF4912 domain-containing protein [Planctomycetota bacterium]